MKAIEVKITTLSPVVLTANRSTLMTGSENSISGTILRGIYARKYMDEHGLGEKAHEDENFRRFFFGGLRFVTARPAKHGLRSIMVARSLQASKDGKTYNDMLVDPNPADYEQGFKSKKGQAVLSPEGFIDYASIAKNTVLHIDRHSEKNRIAGSSQDGGVFTYESVEPGEDFIGFIIGEDAVLADFAEEIKDYGRQCSIGRSSNTQYGHCRLEWGAIRDVDAVSPAGSSICVRLETPLVASKPVIEAKQVLGEMFAPLASGIEVTDIFGGQEELYGYNNAWQAKIPSQYVLAAGTVFRLTRQAGWDGVDLAAAFYGGLGLRREEGFGQLRLWAADNKIKPWPKAASSQQEPLAYKVTNAEVRRAARIIIENKLEKQVKIDAYEAVQRIARQLKGKTHAFAVLESLLGSRTKLAGIQKRMEKAVAEIKSDQLHTHLKNIKCNGIPLETVLLTPTNFTDSLSQGLQDFALKTGVAEAKEGKTIFDAEIRGAAYYDYWLWFFRHARKAAQSEKRRG